MPHSRGAYEQLALIACGKSSPAAASATFAVVSWGVKCRSEKMCNLRAVSGEAAAKIRTSVRMPKHMGGRDEGRGTEGNGEDSERVKESTVDIDRE